MMTLAGRMSGKTMERCSRARYAYKRQAMEALNVGWIQGYPSLPPQQYRVEILYSLYTVDSTW
jgi:hypothetical protein